jgi:hypothetical protein
VKRITITAGIGYTQEGHKLKPWLLDEALAYLRTAFITAVGGFTETDGMGGYVHADGRPVIEATVTWTLYYDGANTHMGHDLAELVRSSLLQESVVLTEEDINVRFVSREAANA